MLDGILKTLTYDPLGFYAAMVATLGVGFWFVDRRAAKRSQLAADESEKRSLRLEILRAEAQVKRHFATFQVTCQTSRAAWKSHELCHGMILKSPFSPAPPEQQEINRLEAMASRIIERFVTSIPNTDRLESEKLEAFIVAADNTANELFFLAAQVPQANRSIR